MSTPHNRAEKGMIAKNVLMPGDPLRAKLIADNYLEDPVLINDVRNVYGYTGTYKGKKITVMASGMGIPSMGIYSYELFKEYDVDNIIRIGSAGSYCEEAKIYDVVLADRAYSESTYALTMDGYEGDTVYPDAMLNEKILQAAKGLNIPVIRGGLHSTDVFYRQGNPDYYNDIHDNKKCVAVEMESFALLHNAAYLGRHAACMVTISDSFVSGEEVDADERQNSFTNMIKIALEAMTLID